MLAQRPAPRMLAGALAFSGYEVKHRLVITVGRTVLMVTCESVGSARGGSAWGRSPALDVEGSEGNVFESPDHGIVGYEE